VLVHDWVNCPKPGVIRNTRAGQSKKLHSQFNLTAVGFVDYFKAWTIGKSRRLIISYIFQLSGISSAAVISKFVDYQDMKYWGRLDTNYWQQIPITYLITNIKIRACRRLDRGSTWPRTARIHQGTTRPARTRKYMPRNKCCATTTTLYYAHALEEYNHTTPSYRHSVL
jgi:hypothetical protein